MTTIDAVLDLLREAINSHDPVWVAARFAADFRAELPHHPARSFTGANHVHTKLDEHLRWEPELTAALLRHANGNGKIWSEWELTEPAADGSVVRFSGPVVLTTPDGRIATARFYLNLVEEGPPVTGRDVTTAWSNDSANPVKIVLAIGALRRGT